MRKFFSYEAYAAARDAGDVKADDRVKLVGVAPHTWVERYEKGQQEDQRDVEAYDKAKAALASGEETLIPAEHVGPILDAFHAHEALHTSHVLIDTWSDHVHDHPYVQANAELTKLASDAMDVMMRLYQAIGAKTDKSRCF